MFIDENGKIFGKLNILDLFIVLFLVLVLAAGGWYFTRDGAMKEDKAYVEYTVEVVSKEDEYLEHIILGEKVVDGITKQEMGEIIRFEVKDAVQIKENMVERKFNAAKVPEKHDVYITIALDADINYPDICAGDEKIKIGKNVSLRSESAAMHGYIVGIDYDLDEIRGLK